MQIEPLLRFSSGLLTQSKGDLLPLLSTLGSSSCLGPHHGLIPGHLSNLLPLATLFAVVAVLLQCSRLGLFCNICLFFIRGVVRGGLTPSPCNDNINVNGVKTWWDTEGTQPPTLTCKPKLPLPQLFVPLGILKVIILFTLLLFSL